MKDMRFDITAHTKDDVEVPVKVTLEYPDGHGFTAVQGLQHLMEEGFGTIITALAAQGDASLAAAMESAGLSFSEEEN